MTEYVGRPAKSLVTKYYQHESTCTILSVTWSQSPKVLSAVQATASVMLSWSCCWGESVGEQELDEAEVNRHGQITI